MNFGWLPDVYLGIKTSESLIVESQGERNVTVLSRVLLMIAEEWLVCVYFDMG